MAGTRERCFYCSDSLGADVEHFMPIALDFSKTFRWNNLLWICANCNREKGDRSPYENGVRVLIDPTTDDPWRHVTIASLTGILAPRYLTPSEVDLRGDRTLELLDTLNREPLAEGRVRVIRRLKQAVKTVVETAGLDSECNKDLAMAIQEDDYGVSRWFARWEGQLEQPFCELREIDRSWRRFVHHSLKADVR